MTGTRPAIDAFVVGAGPNGLAAALTLARAGRSVRVYEAAVTIGGGTRTEELTLPGFRHDVCSSIVPLALASPFFRTVDWKALGVDFIEPDAPVAHALDVGRSVVLERSFTATAANLDADRRTDDGSAWRRLFGPLARDEAKLGRELLRPVVHVPRHPLALARFGLPALRSAAGLARSRFRGEAARALFVGLAAHSMVRLDRPLTAAFGLVLGTYAHAVGWPLVRGGTAAVTDALAGEIRRLGGEIVTGYEVRTLDDLPESSVLILDTTPQAAVAIAGDRLLTLDPPALRPVPLRAGCLQDRLGPCRARPVEPTRRCIARGRSISAGPSTTSSARSARSPAGRPPDRPFTLFAQYARWDPTRAPAGKETAWAYCHVPPGSTVDMTDRIEAELERLAPGFRDLVLARSTHTAADMERHDANYVGGDINAGIADIRQLVFRPTRALDPYHAGDRVYLCSASTPPGGGVHGMGGHLAARSALRRDLR